MMRIEDQPETKRLEMPLFRGNFYRVVYLKNSGVAWHLPDQQFNASEHCIYFAYPGKLESWSAAQKNQGFLVCFTEAFAHIDSSIATFDHHFPFFNCEATSLLPLSPAQAEMLTKIQEVMLQEANSLVPDYKEMLSHLLHQYLIMIRRIYLENTASIPANTKSGTAVYNRFKRVVDDYFAELAAGESDIQASVSLIADRLHLNPSYLNSLIKKLTGNTASSYIHEKTILEAKSYLMHTNLQMAEISHSLGFTHVSYFNRFFKRLTDQTPLSFKKASQTQMP